MSRKDRIERMGKQVPKTLDEINDDVDLGMSRGLKQQRISLPNLKDPLAVNRPMGPNMDVKPLKEYTHDPDIFSKNVLKVRTTGMCYKEIPFHIRPRG